VTAGIAGQSGHRSIRGTLVALSHDSLGVAIDGDLGGAPVQMPVRAISKIELSRGHKRHALAGALAGFVTGAVFALVMTQSIPSGGTCTTTHPNCGGSSVVPVSLGVGLVTASIGGLVGYSIRTEQWRRVDPPPPDARTP
jgi:hypothetical protein